MMFIAQDEEQVYKFVQYMQSIFKGSKIEDYIANPKLSGYKSVHMNDTWKASDKNLQVPIEIQIKTKGMYAAQEATHETIYKNDELKKEKKDELSAVLSPAIELLLDIEREAENGNTKKAEELKFERAYMLEEQSELLERNKDIVAETWKEYGKVRFKLENNVRIKKEDFLKIKLSKENERNPIERKKAEEDQKKRTEHFDKVLGAVYDFYYNTAEDTDMTSDEITGDARRDYAIKRIQSLNYNTFHEILEKSYDKEKFKRQYNRSVKSSEKRTEITVEDLLGKLEEAKVRIEDVENSGKTLVSKVMESKGISEQTGKQEKNEH